MAVGLRGNMNFMTLIKEAEKKIFSIKKENNKKYVQSFFAGSWQNGGGASEFEIINPANQKSIYFIKDLSERQIKILCEDARKAQEYWHFQVSQKEKEKIFQKTAQLVEEHRGTFVKIQVEEGGRLWKFADAEVQGMLNSLWHFHGEISRIQGSFSRSQMKDKSSISTREPYGVILGITPWNSSLVLPARKMFAALAGGNAIILKDSEQTPLALSFFCFLFHKVLEEVLGGHAKEVINIIQVVHGIGATVGNILVEKGDYDKILFTGSRATGALIAQKAGARIKPVSLELGGHASIILMDDFDIERAVSESIIAGFGDSGQRCVALRAIFVHKNIYKNFISRLVDQSQKYTVGDPSEEKTDMGPVINKSSLKNIKSAIDKSVKTGAKILCGGKIENKNGNYCTPTILTETKFNSPTMSDEVFGPIISVMSFDGETNEKALMNALDMVHKSRYGLSNAILTHNIPLAMRCMERVKTGVFYIGRGTTGAEEGKPFGGIKDSGFGREAGSIDEVTYIKQVYVDFHDKARVTNAGDTTVAFKRFQSGGNFDK